MQATTSKPVAIVVEIIGGALLGAAIGVPLALLLGAVIQPRSGSFDDVVGALAGIYFGYVAGVTLGVVLVGRYFKQGGAWWAALIGSIGGAILAIAAASMGLANYPQLVQVMYFGLTPILAALLYTWSANRRGSAG